MSVELARRYGNALDAENWDEAQSLLDPEVEIVRPSGRRYQGAPRDYDVEGTASEHESPMPPSAELPPPARSRRPRA